MPKTDKQLIKRDAKRDLGAELLQAVREMKARKGQVITGVASKAEPVPRFSLAGKFDSGRNDIAEDNEELLGVTRK